MNIGNTRPLDYTYAQLSKVLEQNRTIAQVKAHEAPVEQDFAAHLKTDQVATQDNTLKLLLSFSAEA